MKLRIVSRSLLLFSLIAFCLPSICPAQKRMAFIVGTDSYEKLPESAQLNVAVKDAQLLSDTLKGLEPSFDVTLMTDGKRTEIGNGLLEFMAKAKGAECVLFYFAGHGIEFHGANYLLASDTDLDFGRASVLESKRILEGKAIHLEKVIEMLSKTDAHITVAILDACRNNPLEGTSASISGLTDGTTLNPNATGNGAPVKRIGHVTAPSGMIISYAADVGQSANDGLFTGILAKNMKVPGRSLMEVFAATRMDVRQESEALAAQNRGVPHEPAEYCKLDLGGLQFSFLPVDRPATEKPAITAIKEKATISDPPNKETGFLGNLVASLEKKGKEALNSALAINLSPEETEAAYNALRGTPSLRNSGRTESRELGGITMLWCPPTDEVGFTMGSPPEEEGRNDDEDQRNVVLTRGFWLAATECTLREWHQNGGDLSDRGKRESPNWPVNNEKFDDVQEYFDTKANSEKLPPGWIWSLPTEAQWEYACRAGGSKVFGTRDSISNRTENFRASNETNLIPRLYEVSSRLGNSWGFYDMHGNVQEWCLDWYSKNPRGLIDPTGPAFGDVHVIRGGKFNDYLKDCRAATRAPRHTNQTAGFRQAIVFSVDELERLKKADNEKEYIDLTTGTIYGVGIGDDVKTIRETLEKQGLLNREARKGKSTILFAEYCIFHFHNGPYCNEIWTGRNKVTLSNGLQVGNRIDSFTEKLGRHLQTNSHPNPKFQIYRYRAGLLQVGAFVNRENPYEVVQLNIRPIP